MQDDTNELLRKAAANDPDATELLLNRHRDRLHRMITMRLDRKISARIDASDIVQEVMIDVSRKLPEYLTTRPIAFYPWLRRLAWERMMDAYRTHFVAARRSINREQSIDIPLPDESAFLLADALVTKRSSPSQQVVRDQMKQQVRGSLEKLSPHYRELLTLRYLEQLSIKEIADVMDTTVAAVKMRHMRAMQKLARILSQSNSSGD